MALTPEWTAIGTLALGVAGNFAACIWWASKTDTILTFLQKNLNEMVTEIKAAKMGFVTKDEVSREIGIADKENKALWRNIDELKKEYAELSKEVYKNHGGH